MEAWMAFGSIVAIVAIVLIAGGLIAVIGHMIIGSFDIDKKSKEPKQEVEYTQVKQIEDVKSVPNDYDFEKLDESKAQLEKAQLEKEGSEDVVPLEIEEDDENLDELENRLKEENKEASSKDDDLDDDLFEIDGIIDEISDEVADEEKSKEAEPAQMSEELKSYNIDDMIGGSTEEEAEETFEQSDEMQEFSERSEELETTEDEVPVVESSEEDKQEIEELKKQLADLSRQLEEAKQVKVEEITVDMTEEQCLARLATLEERLKSVKREYKINAKEYRPLKKVVTDLEKYQTKYRRKNAQLAKKKVALYAVNNYVDLDREKAQKIADEIDLVEGLKLSVEHCEQIIEANKDRYPILEHTNKILEDQIANIEADIETTNKILKAIRDKKGGNN